MFTASRHQKVRDREHREKMKQFEKNCPNLDTYKIQVHTRGP